MMKLFAHSRPISVTIFVLLGLLVTHTGNARAFGVYPSGTTGRSISWPQCGGAFTSQPGTFGIVGVTGGRAFYQNPCLVSEYHWAQSAQVAPSLIMNLNAPVGTTAFKAQTGPRGTCAPTDAVCLSYNYGYNAAQSAFADAQSQGTPSSTWWLNVETDNSWADESAQNTQVIQGAIDFLRSQSITTGIYSAARDWQKIAGGFRPDSSGLAGRHIGPGGRTGRLCTVQFLRRRTGLAGPVHDHRLRRCVCLWRRCSGDCRCPAGNDYRPHRRPTSRAASWPESPG